MIVISTYPSTLEYELGGGGRGTRGPGGVGYPGLGLCGVVVDVMYR